MKLLARRLALWQEQTGYIEGDIDLYVYAYEVMFSYIFNLLIATIIAVATNNFITVLLFLVFFIPLRTFAGGYHAITHWRCMISSAIMLLLISIAEKELLTFMNNWSIVITIIIAGVIIFLFAPLEDSNKKLSESEIKVYKKRVRLIFSFEAMLCILFILLDFKLLSMIIAMSFIAEVTLLLLSLFKSK